MSHSGKPSAAVIVGGLGVIFWLLAGSVWSQVAYDHFSYLPLIVRRDTPTPTLTPTSWINCSLKGQVRVAVTPLTLVPLVGATVSYTHTSHISGSGHSGITLTNASGQYAFAPIGVHDTDHIGIQAQAEGYTSEVHAGNAIDACIYGRYRNFALVPWTPTSWTPTPTPTPTPPRRQEQRRNQVDRSHRAWVNEQAPPDFKM